MKVLVSGASGLIGSALVPVLRSAGHDVVTLVRREPSSPSEVRWDPSAGVLQAADLAGVQAAVHLAGAGIADKRWTDAYKQTVLDSRVQGTSLLARTLAALDPRPEVLLSASAVGFYGDTGATAVTEDSAPGSGFLAEVCVAWEAATAPASDAGVRTAHLRTGIVLSASGGSLKRQLPLFRLGVGGPLASGQQYVSWVTLQDEVAAIVFLLGADGVSGAVNLTGPAPVTNAEFTTALARQVHRPALLRVPAFALRLALGEFADEGVVVGQRVLPERLESAGFSFASRDITAALAAAVR